jgi:hypothetical protein
LLVGCACGAVDTSQLHASPPPQTAAAQAQARSRLSNAPWLEDLAFSGELRGNAGATMPVTTGTRSECTGKASRQTGSWASTLVLLVAGQRFDLVVLAGGYKGAGTLAAGVTVQLHTPDLARVWQTQPGDPVAFMVAPDEESGSIDATLSNVGNPTLKQRVSGYWTCRS